MNNQSSAIVASKPVLSVPSGILWGFLGVVAFSFTLPFTRVAAGGLSALFIGSGRAVVAAVLAAVTLAWTRQHWPTPRQCGRLLIVAAGVVVGFPLLTSYALTTAPASHGAVVVGLLPAATAAMAVVRGREQVPRAFWLCAGLGAIAVVSFAALQNGGLGRLHWSDLLLFAAVLAAAIGYAEGGLLAREVGSWQTVSWALVLASPVMIALTAISLAGRAPTGTPGQWAAFGYLSVVSMFLGFVAWYRGLGIGPMATVSQVQLMQPVMSIVWAAIILGEVVTTTTVLGAVAVVVCAVLAVRVRLGIRRPGGHPG